MRTDNQKRKKKKTEIGDEAGMKRRRRSVIIVMAETVLLLLLAITAYGTRILTSYDYEELSPTIYRETSDEAASKNGSTAAPEPRTTIVDETNEEGV